MLKTLKPLAMVCSILTVIVASPMAIAHTPYIVPATFEPVRDNPVTLDASFAENFFVAEIAVDNSEFHVINPDGSRGAIDVQHSMATRVAMEHTLTQEGTYRFSTGSRMGRIFRVYELDGEKKSLMSADEKLPEGAVMIEHFQSITKADTFVSKGAPNNTALTADGKGLELQAKQHPNELFTGDTLELGVLFDGELIDEASVDIFLAKYQFSDNKPLKTLVSKKGVVSFTPEQQGVYLFRVRHRTPAPKGAEAPLYSYTYSMVVEVLK